VINLLADKETGGCERAYVSILSQAGEAWSAPLIPKVAHTALFQAGAWEATPSQPLLAVVRYPVQRVVSAWRHIRTLKQWRERWGDSWDGFVDTLLETDPMLLDRHLRPQYWFWTEPPVAIVHKAALIDLAGVKMVNKTPENCLHPPVDRDDEIRAYYAADQQMVEEATVSVPVRSSLETQQIRRR